MPLKVFLQCDKSFLPKARYVVEMLAMRIGETVRFIRKEECGSSDIILSYGRRARGRRLPGTHVVIAGSEEAWRMYELRERYLHTLAHRCTIDGESSLALFYDRDFIDHPEILFQKKGRDVTIHIDIIAGSFFFLSGWQEWRPAATDIHQRFPVQSSIQYAFGLLNRPIVDQYAVLLEKALEKAGRRRQRTGRYRGKTFAVMMTHDIDHIRKWTPGIIYRECFRYLLLNRRNDFLKDRVIRFWNFLKMLSVRKDPYRISAEKIVSAERSAGAHGTYFFKVGGDDKRDGLRYLKKEFVRRLFRILKSDGHQIGLHPSYNAYARSEMMSDQNEELRDAAGDPIQAVRQHFLRFEMPLTWRIQDGLGFDYDATLGFAGHEGFRMATCHPFRAYDLDNDRPLRLWELPLIAMDDTFVSYRKLDAQASWKALCALLETVKKYRGVAVVLFHNSCYDDFDNPGWGTIFEKTLRWSYENNAALLNGREVLESFRTTGTRRVGGKGNPVE